MKIIKNCCWQIMKSCLLLLLTLSTFHHSQAANTKTDTLTLATVQPISQLIATELLKGTGITIEYLPPRRLPWQRIPSWLRSKASTRPFKRYTAVLTVEALNPDMAAYGLLRQHNIAVIPVDLTAELTPGGSRISPQERNSYFWLNPANLQLMLNIAATDLARIWPDQHPRIRHNHQQLRQQLQQYQQQLDELLLDANVDEVQFAAPQLASLARSLALPLKQVDGLKKIDSLKKIDRPKQTETVQLDGDTRLLFISPVKKQSPMPPATDHWLIDPVTRLNTLSLMERLTANLIRLESTLSK
ncbi:MAG: hypothetical protein OIF57_13890 [Marinobacterium sp.]|nr:hypothetical protein [Marinobacterium sp.]